MGVKVTLSCGRFAEGSAQQRKFPLCQHCTIDGAM